MSKFTLVLVVILLGASLAGNLNAAAIQIYSTGACAGANTGASGCSGGLLPLGANDNNWQYVVRPDAGTTGLNSSLVVSPIGGSPGWVGTDTVSEWLSPVPGGNFAAPTSWTAQDTFSLAGFIPSTLTLNLSVAADNLIAVVVDGTTVFTPACNNGPPSLQPYCFQQFYNTTVNNAQVTGGFLPGTNTIQLLLSNTDNPSPTGFRVEISGNATAITPEPATWKLMMLTLLVAGLAAVPLARRK